MNFIFTPEAHFLKKDFSDYGRILSYKAEFFQYDEALFHVSFDDECKPVYLIACPFRAKHWMHLFALLGTLKRRPIVLMPFMGSLRTLDLSPLLMAAGAQSLFTCDPHRPLIHPYCYTLSAYDLWEPILKTRIHYQDVLVAPDQGSVNRMGSLSKALGCDHAWIDKKREKGQVSGILQGNVAGRHCWILDDLFDSGKTLEMAVSCLKNHGAAQIHVAITHILGRHQSLEKLKKLPLSHVLTLRTLPPGYVLPLSTNFSVESFSVAGSFLERVILEKILE